MLDKSLKILTVLAFLLLAGCGGSGEEGNASAVGVTDTEVVIGSWGPQTGPAAPWGAVVRGMECYFAMLNEEGGIAGRKIRFINRDDGYQPARTRAVVKEMVESEGVFAFCGGIGTAPGMAVKSYLVENGVPWVGPNTGATHFAYPPEKNIFAGQTPYVDEGAILSQYAVTDLGKQKIAILYQNDDYGKGGVAGAMLELQQHDMALVEKASVELTDSDLSSHALRLKNAGADAVLLFTTPKHAAIILGESAKIGFQPTWLTSLTLADMDLMHTITKGLWKDVIFANFIPMPTSEDPLVQKYKAAQQKYYPEERWSILYMNGFTTAELITEGIRRCGKDLTREKLIENLESLQDYAIDFQNVRNKYTYGKDNRQGSRSVYLLRCVNGNEFEKLTDFVESDIDINAAIEMMKSGI